MILKQNKTKQTQEREEEMKENKNSVQCDQFTELVHMRCMYVVNILKKNKTV